MKPTATLLRFATLIITLLCGSSTFAMSFEWGKDLHQMTMNGQIVSGDAERFITVLLSPPKSFANLYKMPWRIELDSDGGSVVEALRISALVEAMHVDTQVRRAGVCSSSCFFIFLSGMERRASGYLSEEPAKARAFGYVGLHRPYLDPQQSSQMSLPNVTDRQRDLVAAVRNHLTSEGVSQRLLDGMMRRSSNEIFWLTQDDLDELGSYNAGYEESLIAKCGFSRQIEIDKLKAVDENDSKGLMEAVRKMDKVIYCGINLIIGPFRDAEATRLLDRLRAGWRPWTKVSQSK